MDAEIFPTAVPIIFEQLTKSLAAKMQTQEYMTQELINLSFDFRIGERLLPCNNLRNFENQN